jgi:putative ATP-dependent endonuclease of OLD family
MRVHEALISNYRGIKTLRWRPTPGINCLIGPGDSTKTTVLDALSLVLAQRWNVQLSDADFYDGDPELPIDIEVTLVDLPAELLSTDVFGQHLRGVAEDGTILDDPVTGTAEAITLGLSVCADLEPVWSVRKDADAGDEPRRIRAAQRQAIPAVRIDDDGAEHLRWTRTSALARMTTGDDLARRLANAQRAARQAVFNDPDPALLNAAAEVGKFARSEIGVQLALLR